MNTATIIEPQSTALTLVTATKDLEPSTAARLRTCFETMFADVEKCEQQAKLIHVTSESQKGDMKLARVLRLSIKEVRVNAEKARKALKEDALREGRAIDGICNVLKACIEPLEEHLLLQETYAERAEQGRKDERKALREQTLRALGTDPSTYTNLGETTEETWDSIRDTAQAAKEKRDEDAKQAEMVKLEVERVTAEKREAEKKERARLEAERVEREKLQLAENERLKAEKASADEATKAERAERERVEAEAKAERERAAKETARVVDEALAERDRAARAEVELAAEKARQASDVTRAEERRVAAALAPDKEKFKAFAAHLRTLGIGDLKSAKAKAAAVTVCKQLEKMANWVENEGAKL